MKIKQHCENGNIVAAENQYQYVQLNNRHWLKLDSTQVQYDNRTSYEKHNVDNTQYSGDSTEFYDNRTLGANDNDTGKDTDVKLAVCNTLYRINENNKVNCTNKTNYDNAVDIIYKNAVTLSQDSIVSETYSITENQKKPNAGILDVNEMSEKSFHQVPRGIVNPNYPGFQHLAHTLQDYPTIENFYHSENDMTDDDIDIDLIDSTNELTFYQTSGTEESKNINNNNVCENSSVLDINCIPNDLVLKSSESEGKNEVPDLLRTISKGNNNGESFYGHHFSETDIENNFYKKDIIGDFNKEVEDEIKLLLNYNININDDLEELRKDIKYSFAKPIENTINNISDVVNHVIKKLVENDFENEFSVNYTKSNGVIRESNAVNKDNETNTRIEMNLTRPTFLLLDTNPKNSIPDAFLSDGKDEINIDYESEINTEHLSYNVESTIKQLSTELRKIIPKLDEMREHDKHWMKNRNEAQILTDSNSNEIEDPNFDKNPSKSGRKVESEVKTENQKMKTIRSEIRSSNDQKKATVKDYCSSSSQRHLKSNISVHIREKAKETSNLGSFDVYNIETALPKIDLDAIENHLKAAKEAERRKRNDREEIRKRLAMGVDTEEYYSIGHIPVERPNKKPSLHSRLQNGKNLQICYMNETASDSESQYSDSEKSSSNQSLLQKSIFSRSSYNHPYQTRPLSVNITKNDKISSVQSAKWRPTSFPLKATKSKSTHSLGNIEMRESDFYALQATLQTEARIALAQAKELARTQMERERRGRALSPVSGMLRASMQRAGAPLAADRRRLSRQLLTDMNVAQLQVIVNSLHEQIETLNETLVSLLMARDELHMSQDAVLVDIEDLTRYLGVKQEQSKKNKSAKLGVRRLASYVHK